MPKPKKRVRRCIVCATAKARKGKSSCRDCGFVLANIVAAHDTTGTCSAPVVDAGRAGRILEMQRRADSQLPLFSEPRARASA